MNTCERDGDDRPPSHGSAHRGTSGSGPPEPETVFEGGSLNINHGHARRCCDVDLGGRVERQPEGGLQVDRNLGAEAGLRRAGGQGRGGEGWGGRFPRGRLQA